jgi:hypothetical protein
VATECNIPGGVAGLPFSIDGGLLTGNIAGGGSIDPNANFNLSITNSTGLSQTINATFVIPLVPALNPPLDLVTSAGFTLTSSGPTQTPTITLDPASPDPNHLVYYGLNDTIETCASLANTGLTGVANSSKTFSFSGGCVIGGGGPFLDYLAGIDFNIGPAHASYSITWGIELDRMPEPEMVGLYGTAAVLLFAVPARRRHKSA